MAERGDEFRDLDVPSLQGARPNMPTLLTFVGTAAMLYLARDVFLSGAIGVFAHKAGCGETSPIPVRAFSALSLYAACPHARDIRPAPPPPSHRVLNRRTAGLGGQLSLLNSHFSFLISHSSLLIREAGPPS